MAKNLIIYYSRKGENYWSGGLKDLEKGNTEYVAEFIAEAVDGALHLGGTIAHTQIVAEYIRKSVGGDLFEIETVREYSPSYMTCIEEAKDELRKKARPELKAYLGDISEYDNVFVCGPCWWGTFPMAVFTQLEKLDFTGKKVMAVMTHEGSGLGGSERDLKHVCRGASFGKGFSVAGHDAAHSEVQVTAWAKSQI